MTLTQLREKALDLSPTERLHLAEAMWDSLDQDTAPFALSRAQRQLIARRRADYHANPESFLTREELESRLDELA